MGPVRWLSYAIQQGKSVAEMEICKDLPTLLWRYEFSLTPRTGKPDDPHLYPLGRGTDGKLSKDEPWRLGSVFILHIEVQVNSSDYPQFLTPSVGFLVQYLIEAFTRDDLVCILFEVDLDRSSRRDDCDYSRFMSRMMMSVHSLSWNA